MQNLAPRVAEDDAHVQQPKRGGDDHKHDDHKHDDHKHDDHKHVDGRDTVDLVVQEAPPSW
jgi:hypothetical protein